MDHSITPTPTNADGIPSCAELRSQYPRLEPFLPPGETEWRETDDRVHYLVSGWYDIQRSLAEILRETTYNDSFNRETLYGLAYAMQTHCAALGDLEYLLMCRHTLQLKRSFAASSVKAQDVDREVNAAPTKGDGITSVPSEMNDPRYRELRYRADEISQEEIYMHGLCQMLTPLVADTHEHLYQTGKRDSCLSAFSRI